MCFQALLTASGDTVDRQQPNYRDSSVKELDVSSLELMNENNTHIHSHVNVAHTLTCKRGKQRQMTTATCVPIEYPTGGSAS